MKGKKREKKEEMCKWYPFKERRCKEGKCASEMICFIRQVESEEVERRNKERGF
jgi:hypothetical protein